VSGHTPGPWFSQGGFLTIYSMSDGDSGTTCAIAKMLREQPGYEQAEANAHLIAAAPDLLAFAESFLDAANEFLLLNNSDEDTVGNLMRTAHAAIEKATQP
jgi:hypothetical protein